MQLCVPVVLVIDHYAQYVNWSDHIDHYTHNLMQTDTYSYTLRPDQQYGYPIYKSALLHCWYLPLTHIIEISLGTCQEQYEAKEATKKCVLF